MKDLIIRDLCKTYNGKTVLDRLNLTIPAGKTTAILAPSGYGKTTLLRCLMGLETADSGTIEGLEGIRVSVVFQEDRLLEGFFICRCNSRHEREHGNQAHEQCQEFCEGVFHVGVLFSFRGMILFLSIKIAPDCCSCTRKRGRFGAGFIPCREWRNGLGNSCRIHNTLRREKWDRRNEHGSMGCGANTEFVSSEGDCFS